ncbi:MAG TPA: efflux transporter outer membrane subunit [Gallionella sp.]|nr:efflux transporter outer membrane subunit [Gallionella sp.]
MYKPLIKIAIASATVLLATGCAVGPDFQRPAPPPVKGYTTEPLSAGPASADTATPSQHFEEGEDIPAQWWTLFHSPALSQLVDRALKANPDLQAAQATLRQARENAYAAGGLLFPSVDANASAYRQDTNGAQSGQPGNPGSLYTVYNATVSVSYGIDLFGVARRTLESLEAQREFERYQLEGAYLTLTSNVVTTAVQEASLRAQIAATRDIIDAESQQLDLLKKQYDVGGVSLSTVLAQQTALAQTRANLPLLEKQLGQIRNQLAALAGYFPSENEIEAFDLEMLQLPQELPVSLPSRLVEQRPDILAAESQLHAASAQIGVATASMFPQLTISGNAGSVATSASHLLSTGTAVWSVGADLVQPIFHGGTLQHQRKAAVAAYDAAAAQYRSVVLSAFKDVANVLDALRSDAAIVQTQTVAAQSAADSLEITRKQYQIGAASYLALLNAQQSYQQTRIALAQARAGRFADTAALFQSLGGGWWNRDDATGEAGQQTSGADKQ